MPKRNRTKEQRISGVQAPPAAPPSKQISEQERAAKLFVESIKAHDAADRAESQRVRDATAREAKGAELRAAKQRAADTIKRLRATSGRRDSVVEAEAQYRSALAELQEFETGERPHWAPAPAPDADVEASPDAEGAHNGGASEQLS